MVKVRSSRSINPDEVKLIEQLLKDELKQPFEIIFEVTPTTVVKSSMNE